MRLVCGLAILALAAAPALAQEAPHINLVPEIQHMSPEEKEQDAIKQKAYQDSLKKIPNAKVSNDPWGSVRSSEAPATAAPKKPQAKSKGQAAN